MAADALSAKYDRFAKVDESADLAESDAVRASEAAVKEREREAWRRKQSAASAVRERWARGDLADADYARMAREAGVSAREVLSELKERQAQRKPAMTDSATVNRGDVAGACRGVGMEAGSSPEARTGGAGEDAVASAGEDATSTNAPTRSPVECAEERKAVSTALLRRGHYAEAITGLRFALEMLGTSEEVQAGKRDSAEERGAGEGERARALRLACHSNLALALVNAERWAEAEAACSAALTLDPTHVKSLLRRAATRRTLGDVAGARVDLSAALAAEPRNADARRLVAELDAAAAPAAAGLGADVVAAGSAAAVNPALRKFCFLDFEIDGEQAGRVVVQLFDDLAPRTCANFLKLCEGWVPEEAGAADAGAEAATATTSLAASAAVPGAEGGPTPRRLCYAGSPVHRVSRGFAIQGGDVARGDGSGCVSIYGGAFADETFAVPHVRPGLVSMANAGPDTNGSQWFILTNAAPHLNGRHVAFGRVVAGMGVVHRVEQVPTDTATEAPRVPVRVSASGVLDARVVSLDAEDDDGVTSRGADALVLAAARGDGAMAAALARAGAEVDARIAVPVDFEGTETVEGLPALAAQTPAHLVAERTALHVAAARGHAAVVRGLLAAHADVEAVDSRGDVPLHLAVRAAASAGVGRARAAAEETVGALVLGGADPLAVTAAGATAAHIAAEFGAADTLRALLRYAGPEPKLPPGSAAAEAAVVVPAGAPAAEGPGESPVGREAFGSSALVAGIGGITALHVAAAGDHAECVGVLLAAGARWADEAAGELTAMHVAAAKGAQLSLARLLEAAGGAGASVRAAKSGKEPLHCAAEHGAPAATLDLLLRSRADVGASDVRGSTPLHWAARGGHVATIDALIRAGAKPDAGSLRGTTALHVAAEHGHAGAVSELLRLGASADVRGRGAVSPLHAASKSGSTACVRMLLEAGADVEAEMAIRVDSAGHGETTRKRALHVAAEEGHVDTTRALLEAGADANALAAIETNESTSFMSPLFAARRGHHDPVVAVLVAAGAVEVSRTQV